MRLLRLIENSGAKWVIEDDASAFILSHRFSPRRLSIYHDPTTAYLIAVDQPASALPQSGPLGEGAA
jgi:hypothetical protein